VSGPLRGERIRLDRDDIAAYAAASGDANPIHLDDAAARAAGLPTAIAHGMLTLGVSASWLLGQLPPGTALTQLKVRFSRPVPAGAAAELTGTAETADAVTGAFQLVLEGGETALRGSFTARPPVAPAGPNPPDEEASRHDA
jgi:acyl dehydratase